MYLVLITYIKSLEEVDRYLEAHCDYVSAYLSIGNFIFSGPQEPRTGDVILLKAESREEVDDILRRDPWKVNGVADYQVVEFSPMMIRDQDVLNVLTREA